MSIESRARVRAPAAIASVIAVLFAIAYVIIVVTGIPPHLDLPLWLRILGAPLLLAGMGMAGWTFEVRGPGAVIVSTYITLSKFVRRAPLEARAGREEPLVVAGPYAYARSPLYFGVVASLLGLAVLTTYSLVLVAAVVIFLWFRLVLIPFEEKELVALFGSAYEEYQGRVPAMFPFTKRPKNQPRT